MLVPKRNALYSDAPLDAEAVSEPVPAALPPSATDRISRVLRALKHRGSYRPLYILLAVLLVLYFRAGPSETDTLNQQLTSARSTIAQLSSDNERLSAELRRLKPETEGTQIISEKDIDSDGSERDDAFYGPKDSGTVVMVFSDFNCRKCREFHTNVIPLIRSEFADAGKLKLIYRDFPLQDSGVSILAAEFAQCSGEQGKYWKAFELMSAQPEDINVYTLAKQIEGIDQKKLLQCMSSDRYETEIKRDQAQALALGAQGAPTMFIASKSQKGAYRGVFIRGAQPYPVIKGEILKIIQKNSAS